MIITMRTSIPLPGNLTVEELVRVLLAVPDQKARVAGAVTKADRYGSDSYRLELSWSKQVDTESQRSL